MNAMKPSTSVLVCAVMCYLCLLPGIANAESFLKRISLKPELMESDNADLAFGIQLDLNADSNPIIENDTVVIGYTLKGEWATESSANTDPLTAKLDLFFDWLKLLDKDEIYVHGQFSGGYQSDDRFEEQELAGGATLAVVPRLFRSFKLSLLSHYDWVYSFESKRRKELNGAANDDFGRLQLEALGVLRLRKLVRLPILKSLKLSGNYRYFSHHGLDDVVETLGENDFDYWSVDLAYEWWPNGVFGWVQELFVTYSEGHLPTEAEDQSVWKVGIVFYGASSIK